MGFVQLAKSGTMGIAKDNTVGWSPIDTRLN